MTSRICIALFNFQGASPFSGRQDITLHRFLIFANRLGVFFGKTRFFLPGAARKERHGTGARNARTWPPQAECRAPPATHQNDRHGAMPRHTCYTPNGHHRAVPCRTSYTPINIHRHSRFFTVWRHLRKRPEGPMTPKERPAGHE